MAARPASVVVFGTYDTSAHDRVAVLRDGLRDRGHDVVEVNAPLPLTTDERIAATRSAAGVLRLLVAVGRCWAALTVARLRLRERPDVVVVGYLGHFDVHLARALYPRSSIVLDHLIGLGDTAADRGTGGSLTRRLLTFLDRRATAAADVVLLDTEEQFEIVTPEHRGRCIVVPVGSSDVWSDAADAAPAPDVEATPLRVVFFGLYTPLQGCPIIGRAIALLAERDDIEFTMIGTGQDRAVTQAEAATGRVRWIDWMDPDALAAEVRGHHVSLGVFGTGPKTARVVPHKVFESMTLGCAVVTAATPAQQRLLGDAVLTVPAGDASALAACIAALADDRSALRTARETAAAAAAAYRPEAAVAPLDEVLDRRDAVHPRRPRLPALTLNAWLRWDLVDPVVRSLPPGRALEIGPGRGAVAARLVELGYRYTGAEMADAVRASTAALLARRTATARMIGALDELEPDEVFELVCAFEVIEHIEDDAAAMQTWADRLAPGGTLIVSTPADPDRFAAADDAAGHFRRYPAETLADLARRAGLADVTVRHYGAGLGDVLERGRNVILGRRLERARAAGDGPELRERTEASSSMLQPPDSLGTATRLATLPARRWQRRRPDRGPGLVLTARRTAS
ncbi:MAG: methyltransferase domain-containing protein [Microthrixaceae bacterium]